jgi:hypothetical protein
MAVPTENLIRYRWQAKRLVNSAPNDRMVPPAFERDRLSVQVEGSAPGVVASRKKSPNRAIRQGRYRVSAVFVGWPVEGEHVTKEKRPGAGNPYHDFGPTGLVGATHKLKRGDYLSGPELAAIIEANADQVLPAEFCEYLVRFLRGSVKAKRGPKPRSDFAHLLKLELLVIKYEHALRVAKLVDRCARAKARARGDRLPRAKEAAHELAQRYLQKSWGLFPDLTPAALRNLISSQRKLRK